MSSKYKFNDQSQLYFVSFSVINWIDLFIRNEYKEIILKSWKHCQDNKGLEIYGWCMMSSHIHMIIGPEPAARVFVAAARLQACGPTIGNKLIGSPLIVACTYSV